MLGLRSEGIDVEKLKADFNIDLVNEKYEFFAELLTNDFVFFDNSKMRLTQKGFLLCEEIIQNILSKVNV